MTRAPDGVTAMSGTRTELIRQRADLGEKLARVEADIETIKAELAVKLRDVQGEAQKLRSLIGNIDSELARREAADNIVPTISDHALLRYIERVYGVDVEAMKAELLTEGMVAAIKSGATGLKTGFGTFIIKGNTVVTFLGVEMRPKRKTKRGLREVDADYDDETAA